MWHRTSYAESRLLLERSLIKIPRCRWGFGLWDDMCRAIVAASDSIVAASDVILAMSGQPRLEAAVGELGWDTVSALQIVEGEASVAELVRQRLHGARENPAPRMNTSGCGGKWSNTNAVCLEAPTAPERVFALRCHAGSMAGGMSSRRGPTLAERSAGTAVEVGAEPEPAALQDRPRPVLTRHCWVTGLSACPGRWAGLLAG